MSKGLPIGDLVHETLGFVNINKTNHGLIAGNVFRPDFSKSYADNDDLQEVSGIVYNIIDNNNFIGFFGRGILSLTTEEWDSITGDVGGLSNEVYYLNHSSFPNQLTRNLTDVELTSPVKSILQGISSTQGLFINYPAYNRTLSPVLKDGVQVMAYKKVTEDYDVTNLDWHIVSNAEEDITINLPYLESCVGRVFHISKLGFGNVLITTNDSALISGESEFTILSQYDSIKLHNTNTEWVIL